MFKIISYAVKTIGAVVMLLAVTTTVSAQDHIENAPQKLTDKIKADVALTDAQYAKVLEINTEFVNKAKEAKKPAEGDKKAKVERAKVIKVLNEEKDAKLKTVLTEEQYKTYITKKEQRKALSKQNRLEDGKADAFQKGAIKKS